MIHEILKIRNIHIFPRTYVRTSVREHMCGQLLNVYNGVYFYGDFLGQPSIDGLDSVQIMHK